MSEKILRIAIPAVEKNVQNYLKAFRTLGACPEIVGRDCDPANYDGLLLPGGPDVEPWRFGEENTASGDMDADLDDLQFTVLDSFLSEQDRTGRPKPILGICRGHQLLNVRLGGTLIQHLETSTRHSRDEGSSEDKVHCVVATGESFLQDLYGKRFYTNSSHHQAVKKAGPDLRVVLRAEEDETVEGFVHTYLPIYGVQFHPERMCFDLANPATVDGSLILKHFLKDCER